MINRQGKKSKEEPCQRLKKNVINRNWGKFCYISDGVIFCLTMMYFLKKFRKSQTKSSRKSRKISLQSKRISKRRSGRCCIDERKKAFSGEKKKNFTSRTKLCCFKESFLFSWWSILDATELSYQKEAS